MNSKNPKFWALIGFGLGAVLAAAGQVATPLDSIVGGLIQAGIWFGVSTLILKSKAQTVAKSIPDNSGSIKFNNSEEFVTSKICDQCSKPVPMDFVKCSLCNGSTFTHKRIAKSEAVEITSPNLYPDTKLCKFCAEEVKFAAVKCKHCGSEI
jgi:ribosomal protein L40E